MRSKVLIMLIAALALSCGMGISAYAERAFVSGDGVNLRSGPSTGYRIIDCLDYGTALQVIDSSAGSWYAVDYNGKLGFIRADFLSVDQPTYSDISDDYSSFEEQAYINAMYVRLRSGPGQEFSILGEYSRGKSVRVVGRTAEWTACIVDGRQGYIFSDYISIDSYAQPIDKYAGTGRPNDNTQSPSQMLLLDLPLDDTASVQNSPPPAEDYSLDIPLLPTPTPNYSYTPPPNTHLDLDAPFISHPEATDIDEVSPPVLPTEAPVSSPVPLEPPQSPASLDVELSGTEGYVCGNNVRMRAEASMSSDILDELFYGNRVTVFGFSGEWTAVEYNGVRGYIYSQYVRQGSITYSGETGDDAPITPVDEQHSDLGLEIVKYAMQYLGCNYTWGGTSPETGFDCSGFVYYVFQQFGYTLNRIASDQASNGTEVSDSAQAGDIICFYSNDDWIGHVGIYIGDNRFIHAQNSATGVVISELSGYYTSRGYEIRRII